MGIFDGYENQSPEELAKKLGISKSSTMKNSKEEITETLNLDDISEDHHDFDPERCDDYYASKLHKGIEVLGWEDEKGIVTNTKSKEEEVTIIWANKKKKIKKYSFSNISRDVAKVNIAKEIESPNDIQVGDIIREKRSKTIAKVSNIICDELFIIKNNKTFLFQQIDSNELTNTWIKINHIGHYDNYLL